MIFEINERDACRWRAVLKDDDESPVVPGTGHWRLDCATTGQSVRDWTAVAIQTEVDDFGALTAAYATIDIPASANAIIDRCNPRETKRLLFAADLGTEYEQKQQKTYDVVNLQGIA